MTRLGILALVILVACGGDDAPPSDDAGSADGSLVCTRASECDDGLFCNGAESCDPSASRADARGCVAGSPPCAESESCDEAASECETCRTDADGDGAIAVACGGDDCDDDDPDRYPGNLEVCDSQNRDEACDPTTLGDVDADEDGFVSALCCNVVDGASTCGDDCDDARPNVHQGATEACDGFDNDCDGSTDEGVLRSFFPDTDGDGYGDEDAEARRECTPPSGFVEDATDCDDTARTVNPVAAERCANEVDDDCDGDVDEAGMVRYYRDADEDTYGALGDFVDLAQCEPPTGYVAVAGDCNDTSAAYYPSAPDPCDGRDTSCNLPATPGAADPAEDADLDGHTATGASCEVGDVGFGSYPKDDCDDTAASVHPGATELCNRRDDVCASGGGVRTSEDEDGDLHAAPGASCTGGYPKDDCVDTDPTIHPEATERCDRLDNVCASGGGVRASEDVDDDGHAPASASCTGGFPKDDCVDTNAAIHPGAPELCDRLDNVCASGGGVRASEDADEDGFAALAASCTGGPLPRTDCDDSRDDVFPGAREACGGGDQDCDAMPDASDADATRWCGPHASCDGSSCALDATLAVGGFEADGGSFAVRGGQLVGWGSNQEGRLGISPGTLTDERSPRPTVIASAARVFAGPRSTCLLEADGDLVCWGAREPFGDASPRTPSGLAIPNAIEVAATIHATCARTTDERLLCVGSGDSGEIFSGSPGSTPVELDLGLTDGFSQLVAGTNHLCALARDGRVICWGNAADGRLGHAGSAPSAVAGLVDAREVAAGGAHTCAIREGGSVVCFGANASGQLGDGGDIGSSSPVAVASITDAVQLALGTEHSCALLAGGSVRCWGRNDRAQLGDGTLDDHATPVAVSGLTDAVFVVASHQHTCARRATGDVVCWGTHDHGELGDGSDSVSVPFPVPVTGLTNVQTLRAGSGGRQCVVRTGGEVRCWGDAPLGDGSASASATPVVVSGAAGATSLGGYAPATCARVGTELRCWGRDLLAGAAPSNTPIATVSSTAAPAHGPSARHHCWVTAGGLRCLGNNDAGELGDGTTTDAPAGVAAAFTLPSITSLAVATSPAFLRGRTCAVYDGGRVACWGSNLGSVFGDGTTSDSSTPVDATGLTGVTELATADLHTCSRSGGQVHCWGLNFYGEVGDGTTTQRSAPVATSITNAVSVATHSSVSCAALATGGLRCWGRGAGGRLGTGTYTDLTSPGVVDGVSNAVEVSVADSVCARLATNEVVCWGLRSGLGNADYTTSPRVPVTAALP
ncbi:MAG: MopE-related protein [Polyangiales bacterium]